MKKLLFLLLIILIGCSKDPLVSPETKTFKDTRDGHNYDYVRIGTQTWMAENLAFLPEVSSENAGSDIEPLYYVYGDYSGSVDIAKANSNYSKYGVLYNWEATKTACPSGWHLPSDAEWKKLEMFLGMSQEEVNADGLRESGSVGEALKSRTLWSNDGNGNNSSGFEALPSGYRNSLGIFFCLGDDANFWASSDDGSYALCRNLNYSHKGVYMDYPLRWDGYSIRCVKN